VTSKQPLETVQKEFAHEGILHIPEGVMIYNIEGPLFYGAMESFEQALASTHTDPKVLIIRMHLVPFIDSTGLQSLETAIDDLQRRGVHVMISGARPAVRYKLKRMGLISKLGIGNVKDSFSELLERATMVADIEEPAAAT
ncbi:MAG TPA: sodium-independent anion transporter, partial [Burkholderiaceae bacterium]|nr:sodium-independent anion transporter [Burkholderiaceae bacterium]